jgi:hypothetical protein
MENGADIAQTAERDVFNVEVAGSMPVVRSIPKRLFDRSKNASAWKLHGV